MASAPVVLVEEIPDGFVPTSADIKMALDEYDRRRYRRLGSSPRRNRFVYGRMLLRTTLSRVTKGVITPEQWCFTRTPLGKPVLDPARIPYDLSFSLSYSGPLIAVAVANAGCLIGVDIELLDSRKTPDISAVLSSAEQSFLADLPQKKKYPALMKIWTAKEAIAKMVGLGFVLNFSSFTIIPASPPLLCSSDASLRYPEKICLQNRDIYMQRHRCTLSVAMRQEKEK